MFFYIGLMYEYGNKSYHIPEKNRIGFEFRHHFEKDERRGSKPISTRKISRIQTDQKGMYLVNSLIDILCVFDYVRS